MEIRNFYSASWIFIAACILGVRGDTEDDERAANDVEITVYQVSLDEWNGGAEDSFQKALAQAANDYCASDYEMCGLKDGWQNDNTFQSDHIEFIDGYPSYSSPYLKVAFVLRFPDNVNTTSTMHFVPRAALQEITLDAVDQFNNYTDRHIVEVGDVELSIPPNNTLNIIMCIVGVILLVIVLTICLVLNWKCGVPPDAVEKEGASKSTPVALEMSSVEEVKRVQPQAGSANGAKTDAIAVET